ncbi:hypothetical protein E1B28_006400 [Marasmius oreades]|uniref:Uncharacterized protein n=1 Tax=Marasmius oreades TaxID=181124 RepID=A0A9P7UW54_9AGAR|nr:uncharacterized protein E1B28_006400 [Marasmius oreades]KAG7095686.1 hypothetical protein E1B28_006400 [Marasmius oreades]
MANSQTPTYNLQTLALPVEIIIVVLKYTIRQYPDTIVCVLSTCSLFYNISQNILHQELAFTSLSQLHRFTQALSRRQDNCYAPEVKPYLVCSPRSLSLDVAGGASWILQSDSFDGSYRRVGTWDLLREAVKAMIADLLKTANLSVTRPNQLVRDEHTTPWDPTPKEKLAIESVRLRLNSHAQDAKYVIYDALRELDPISFTWTGPDPPHHFSIAIVRDAVPPLFLALSTYTQLTRIKLTNISFPEDSESSETSIGRFELPFIPTLQFFHLGQSTFLAARTIARFVLKCIDPERNVGGASTSPDSAVDSPHVQGVSFRPAKQPSIEEIRLVDVYEGSIWGIRLRMPQIINAALALLEMDQQFESGNSTKEDEVREAIMKIVKVEVETERIEGGDRGI